MTLKRLLSFVFKPAAAATHEQPLAPELRKAAVLVASLDPAAADALLGRMPEQLAARVRRVAAGLGTIDGAEQAAVMHEFASARPRWSPARESVAEQSSPVELQLSGEHRVDPADEGLGGMHFRLLQAASRDKLRPLLQGEHPQTIALVISHLPGKRAAEMLATLDGRLQAEVIRRLVNLQQANPEVLREVERGLESRMLEQTVDERRQAAGIASVAGILAAASPSTRQEILGNVSRHDRHLASRLVDRDLSFADLEQISGPALATLLEAAGMQLTVLALAGAGPALQERMLAAVGPDTAALLTGALEGMGPTRLSDVEQAQHELVALARQLEAEGRIDLSGALAEILA